MYFCSHPLPSHPHPQGNVLWAFQVLSTLHSCSVLLSGNSNDTCFPLELNGCSSIHSMLLGILPGALCAGNTASIQVSLTILLRSKQKHFYNVTQLIIKNSVWRWQLFKVTFHINLSKLLPFYLKGRGNFWLTGLLQVSKRPISNMHISYIVFAITECWPPFGLSLFLEYLSSIDFFQR